MLGQFETIMSLETNAYENISTNLPKSETRLFSKNKDPWITLDDSGNPDTFLDISSDDSVISVFRSRFLLVNRPESVINVLGKDIDFSSNRYIYDIYSGKTFGVNELPEGSYYNSDDITRGSLDLKTGIILKTSLLKTYNIIDIEPFISDPVITEIVGAETKEIQQGSPIISNSPNLIGSKIGSCKEYIYVLKEKVSGKWSVLSGPSLDSRNTKLSNIVTFIGKYHHVSGPWLARDHQVDNLVDPKKSFKISESISSGLLTLNFKTMYFVQRFLVIHYESKNFESIMKIAL